jgi:hypothetical protein
VAVIAALFSDCTILTTLPPAWGLAPCALSEHYSGLESGNAATLSACQSPSALAPFKALLVIISSDDGFASSIFHLRTRRSVSELITRSLQPFTSARVWRCRHEIIGSARFSPRTSSRFRSSAIAAAAAQDIQQYVSRPE